jgi:hypothetical protein
MAVPAKADAAVPTILWVGDHRLDLGPRFHRCRGTGTASGPRRIRAAERIGEELLLLEEQSLPFNAMHRSREIKTVNTA